MSSTKNFNDPFDGKAFFYDNRELLCFDELKAHDGRFIDDFSDFSISTALTANGVNSMPMWAHYGSNHSGFCVSYDMKDKYNLSLSSNTFPIQYISERIEITSYIMDYVKAFLASVKHQQENDKRVIEINDISIVYISILLNNLKHFSWSYENEFRCSVASKAFSSQYIDATPKEIFIGMKCSEEYSNRIKRIGEILGVPVYKMIFDEYSQKYNLTPTIEQYL